MPKKGQCDFGDSFILVCAGRDVKPSEHLITLLIAVLQSPVSTTYRKPSALSVVSGICKAVGKCEYNWNEKK